MPFRGFTSLATSSIDIALKNDLNNLDRYLHEVATQLALLNKAEPLGSAQSEQNESSIANHAATHGNLGSDSIEGRPFTWTGAHIFTGNDVIIKDSSGNITHRFLTTSPTRGTWLTGNLIHRVAAQDIVNNGATLSMETINASDDPIHGPWTALKDNDILGQIIFGGTDTLLSTSTPGTRIRSMVDGTVIDGRVPAEIQLWTTSPTDHAPRLTIKNDGKIAIGTDTTWEPHTQVHIKGPSPMGITTYAEIGSTSLLVESIDAVLGLYSDDSGAAGSGIHFAETVPGGGAVQNAWNNTRQATNTGTDLNWSWNVGTPPWGATPSMVLTTGGDLKLTGALGLGTTTIPHAGVGLASTIIAIDGTAGGSNGPHIQVTVNTDNHPIAQYFHGGHDNVGFSMDAYYNGDPGGAWVMGDTSSFAVYKNTDWLRFTYATGTVGTEVVQQIALAIDSSGVLYHGSPTNTDLMLYETIATPTLTGAWTFNDTITLGGSPALDNINTVVSMEFTSNVIGPRTAFTFNADGATPSRCIRFQATGTTIAQMNINGDFMYGSDADDLFIHEKALVITTNNWTPGSGTWDFTAATVTGIPASAISPLATKGDIWCYSTVDTRLAAGVTGSILLSDLAQATGLRWLSNTSSTAGDVLTSGGASVNPSWVTPGLGGHIIRNDAGDLTTRTGLHFLTAHFATTDDVGNDETDVALELSMTPSWTGLHTFSAGLALLDSDPINIGTGTDMVIQHNGTDNLFTSNVRTAALDEVGSTDMGFRFLHDTNTTSSVGENTGSGRFGPTYNEATAVVELAVDAGGAEHTFGWISAGAAAHRGLGNLLPCLVFHNNDNATLPWSKGFACGMVNNSDSNFTGILSSAETRLDFYADNVRVFRADKTTGLILGEAAAEGKIGTQAASTLILESDDPPAGQPWVFVRTKTDQTGSGATNRAFAVHHNLPAGLNYPLFTVWPSDQGTATYGTAQIAVHADGQLCFDAPNASNGTTRGDTYFVYDSANATADFFVDATEIWNADTTTFNTLVGRKVATSRYTTTQTLGTTDHHVACDTDGAAFTVTLPAGVAGTQYRIANTGTSGNNLTITPNGAELLIGVNSNFTLLDGEALLIVYEATEGWF